MICFIFRNICNPSIKLLVEGRETTSMQKLFIGQPDSSFLHSKSSRQINPNERFFVVISTEVLALCEQEEILLLLTWYNGSEDEFDNEIFVKEDKKAIPQQQLCTEIKISVADVLSSQRGKGFFFFLIIIHYPRSRNHMMWQTQKKKAMVH